MASIPVTSMLKQSKTVPFNLSEGSKILQQRELLYEYLHAPSVEIFEVADKPFVPSVQHFLQTSKRQKKL